MADYISEDKINSFKEEIDYIMFNILRSFTYKFCSGLFKYNWKHFWIPHDNQMDIYIYTIL